MMCNRTLLQTVCALLLLIARAASTRYISPDDLVKVRLFSAYAGAAYCAQNYLDPGNETVVFPNTPFPRNSTGQIFHSFVNVSDALTTGTVALDHARQLVVISFRGTVSQEDWQTNLDLLLGDASDVCGEGCFVHSGFLESWRGARHLVLNAWSALQMSYQHYQTVVTGHSLGGALAHLCAIELKTRWPDASVSLYTYGSPRVGNQVFASIVEQSPGSDNYRLTHLNDPVPRLNKAFGYAHAGPEYHITSPHIPDVLSANKSTLAKPANMIVRSGDVQVFTGPENESGNLSYDCANIAMHDEYFLHIADCATYSEVSLLGGRFGSRDGAMF